MLSLVAIPYTALGANALQSARTPLYRATLEKAQAELRASSSDKPAADSHGATDAQPAHVARVTADPDALTACVDGTPFICTRSSAGGTTRCAANSNTVCGGDPQCIVTTNPPWRTTMCRGANTMCRGAEQVVCTFQSGRPTTCPVSRTFCPGRAPGEGDPNCFTFRPGGSQTLCQNAQTFCDGDRMVICTRDPMSTTRCTSSSRTRCGPSDPICPPQNRKSSGMDGAGGAPDDWRPEGGTDPLCVVEPDRAPVGTTRQIGLFCFDTYLVEGEMHAYFGNDIQVLDYEVTSSMESSARIEVPPDAVQGPRLVLVHAGDDPVLSPGAYPEFVIAVGLIDVVPLTPTDQPFTGGSTLVRLRSLPNPFRGTTSLQYDMPVAGSVRVLVFDASGRLVRRVAEREDGPGRHTVQWDGRDDGGTRLPPGVYFAVVQTAAESVAWKLVLAR